MNIRSSRRWQIDRNSFMLSLAKGSRSSGCGKED